MSMRIGFQASVPAISARERERDHDPRAAEPERLGEVERDEAADQSGVRVDLRGIDRGAARERGRERHDGGQPDGEEQPAAVLALLDAVRAGGARARPG